MFDAIDLLICGAGPVGCVIAERAANELGWKVLIVDRRGHVGGNCHDSVHNSGVLIQNYGPHYFRTNSRPLLDYLSRFTEWIPGNYIVKSFCRGQLFDFPINLNTLEQFFGLRLDQATAEQLLMKLQVPTDEPRNSEEFVLSRVGRELYEAFYLNYTLKHWNIHPSQLSPRVCGRIPIRLNRDNRYVEHRFQVMPRQGFTKMFARMIDDPRIRVLLSCDYRKLRTMLRPRYATVYSGPIDEYFDWRFGRLPYRSLRFDVVTYPREQQQPCVQINYPNDYTYTRSVEFKHITAQKHPHTVVSYETSSSQGEPYYPIPCADNQALYERYAELAAQETQRRRVYFCGRLATYNYLNTDEVILSAFKCFEKIREHAFVPAVCQAA